MNQHLGRLDPLVTAFLRQPSLHSTPDVAIFTILTTSNMEHWRVRVLTCQNIFLSEASARIVCNLAKHAIR